MVSIINSLPEITERPFVFIDKLNNFTFETTNKELPIRCLDKFIKKRKIVLLDILNYTR